MNDTAYKESFKLFLKSTDEKSVIKQFVHENIPIRRSMKFLDIGGGDGSLTAVISRRVRSTLFIEPNRKLLQLLPKQKGTSLINAKWEDVKLHDTFDFILAAYVVTYFPRAKRKSLIKKMYRSLRPGGHILILSVDAKKGSWREIHTFFYKLMGRVHKSSDDTVKEIAQEYGAISKTFRTRVAANDADEMLKILNFDFHRYPGYVTRYRKDLKKFLKDRTAKNKKVALEMVHNAYIITKKEI